MCKNISIDEKMNVDTFLKQILERVSSVKELSGKIKKCLEKEQYRSLCMDVAALEEDALIAGKLSNKYSREFVRQLATSNEKDEIMISRAIHDMNNMLGVIVGYIDMVVEDCKNKHYKRAIMGLECMLEASFSAIQIIEIASPRLESVDLIKSIEIAIKLSNPEKNDIRVITSFPSKEVKVRGDKIALMNVLSNIFLNGMHAIGKKWEANSHLPDQDRALGIFVKVGSDEYVEVEVVDNGTGIHSSLQDNIFSPRFTTKGQEGTGMGLYSCKNILLGLGGKISFKSWPGQGTSFSVSLPVC